MEITGISLYTYKGRFWKRQQKTFYCKKQTKLTYSFSCWHWTPVTSIVCRRWKTNLFKLTRRQIIWGTHLVWSGMIKTTYLSFQFYGATLSSNSEIYMYVATRQASHLGEISDIIYGQQSWAQIEYGQFGSVASYVLFSQTLAAQYTIIQYSRKLLCILIFKCQSTYFPLLFDAGFHISKQNKTLPHVFFLRISTFN